MNSALINQLIGIRGATHKITFRCFQNVYDYIKALNERFDLRDSESTRLLIEIGIEHAETELIPLLEQLSSPPGAID